MPCDTQPRRGGHIEIVSENAVAELVANQSGRSDSTAYVDPQEKFINDYIQQNSKRVKSGSSSGLTGSSSLSSDAEIVGQQASSSPVIGQRSPSRHASARRLFEMNEWNEQQKRLKQKRQSNEPEPNRSYDEIKATTQQLLKDYDQLMERFEFETNRRREYIYRNYRCRVREPLLLAKLKQFERLERNRSSRTRFKAQQYDQFLEFINKHRFITRDDYDKKVYDAMAKFDDKSPEIFTPCLSDPTLLPYHKWMSDRRIVSSLGCRSQTPKIIDPRRVVSEQGFRSYHRTAIPFADGRTAQSALSWHMHDQTNVDSQIRRLASAKCYHFEQQSHDPTHFDPTERQQPVRRSTSSSAASTRTCSSSLS